MGKGKDLIQRKIRTDGYNRGKNTNGTPDGQGYRDFDSGCKQATRFLGSRQSLCLECPFDVCLLDRNKRSAE